MANEVFETYDSPENSAEASPREGDGNTSARPLIITPTHSGFFSRRRAANGVIALASTGLVCGLGLTAISIALNLVLSITIVGALLAVASLAFIIIAGIYKSTLDPPPSTYARENDMSNGSPTISKKAN